MKTKQIVCILLALVLLTGCASGLREEGTLPEASFTQESAGSSEAEPGYYIVESYLEDGIYMAEEDLSMLKQYLLLREDHTGLISTMGQSVEITWDEAHLIMDGSKAPYVLDDGRLVFLEDKNQIVFRYVGQELPEEYLPKIPVGFFAVGSVSRDGDLSIYGSIDPANGYIRIREDRTGEMFFDGMTREFTVEEGFLYMDSVPVMYQYIPASDSTEDDEDLLMVVLITDIVTSIAFRPAEDPEKI